jgi:hypothetical protein
MMKYFVILILLTACNPFHIAEKRKAFALLQAKSKETVTDFIKNYAQYPETYEPISFGYFERQMGNASTGEHERFTIFHEFTIRNLIGELTVIKTYFFLNENFVVCVVYNELHPNGAYAYSSLKLWTSTVGRQFTQEELDELKEQFKVFDN